MFAGSHRIPAIALATLASLALAAGSGCGSTAPAPVPLTVLSSPQPVKVLGGTMIVHEVYVGDYRARGLTVSRIVVRRDGPDGAILKTYAGEALQGTVMKLPATMQDLAILLLGLVLPEGSAVPATLHHEVTFEDGTVARGGVATVLASSPLRVGPPVRGDRWYVGNGPGILPVYHRDAMLERAGRFYAPERFAVDWVQLGEDGRAFRGEGLLPEDWVSHGADLVAVADGTIQDARDGVPDNTPVGAYVVPMTSENLLGNYVVLDVRNEHQAFAVYGHLVPGSLRVKIGDRVTAGQVLGKLGNSGNSGAPHLHFHVCDGRGPGGGTGEALACNGLPYELPTFGLLGTLPFDDVNAGIPFVPVGPPRPVADELVLGEQIVNLGP